MKFHNHTIDKYAAECHSIRPGDVELCIYTYILYVRCSTSVVISCVVCPGCELPLRCYRRWSSATISSSHQPLRCCRMKQSTDLTCSLYCTCFMPHLCRASRVALLPQRSHTGSNIRAAAAYLRLFIVISLTVTVSNSNRFLNATSF